MDSKKKKIPQAVSERVLPVRHDDPAPVALEEEVLRAMDQREEICGADVEKIDLGDIGKLGEVEGGRDGLNVGVPGAESEA